MNTCTNYYHREKALENIKKSGATRGKTIEEVNKKMMAELKEMDMDADPEGALKIFLYYMQVRENSYMSIESGLAKRPLLEKGTAGGSRRHGLCGRDAGLHRGSAERGGKRSGSLRGK